MKKVLSFVMVLVLAFAIIGCTKPEAPATEAGNAAATQEGTAPATAESKTLNVGVAFFPMKEILELVKEDLKADGFDLTISEFTDYQAPNNLLKDKELDANMIQHDYFLQSFNEANGSDLVTVQPIYHATFALYAKDFKSVEEIPDGTAITLPDDETNHSRALYLLGQAGLLTFKDGKTVGLTVADIETNPKNLNLEDQVPLTSLAQRYTETGVAVMYPTYAKSLELKGDEQRVYVEKQDDVTKNYAISLVTRADNQDSEGIQALIKHLKSDKVKQFLIDKYGWASTPAF